MMVLGLLASVSLAQQTPKIGLGFEFHTFPSSFLMGEVDASGIGVYVPIDLGGFFIEPHISFTSSSTEMKSDDFGNYKTSDTRWQLLIGAFISFKSEKTRIYAGARVGKFWSRYKETDEDDIEYDSFILAPTLGAEYFIADKFSFGGEGLFNIETRKDDENPGITITQKTTTLIPKLIVRFYF